MKYTDEAYIKLIANAIGKNEYDIDFSLVSLDRLMKLCAFHKTAGLVCVGINKLEKAPLKYKKIFQDGLKLEVIEYVNKSNLLDELSNQLTDRGIKHILIKGKSIAKYYPQEELRRLGDIDLLISSKDKGNVKHIIEKMGATHIYERSDEYVDFYRTEKVDIEIHSKIVTGKWFSDAQIYKDFTEIVFAKSQVISGQLYEPDFVTSMVYNVYHTAKHFYEGGCGIRMIADLWLMRKAAEEDIFDEVLKTLEIMGLKNFAIKIFKIGDKWFGNSKEEIVDLPQIQNYIIKSGLYGNGNVNSDVAQMRKSKKGNYIGNVFKWLFPSYKQMKESSLWFKDKPAILLPIAYIVRGYTNVKERGGIIKTSTKILKGHKENSNLNNMLRIMELENE